MLNREKSIAELRTILQPGSTVYTEIAPSDALSWPRATHIRLYVIKDEKPQSITVIAGCAIGSRMNQAGDAIVSLRPIRYAEFAVVGALSAALFPNGFECIGKGCPSHEHPMGDTNYAPHLHKDRHSAIRTLGLKYRNKT